MKSFRRYIKERSSLAHSSSREHGRATYQCQNPVLSKMSYCRRYRSWL